MIMNTSRIVVLFTVSSIAAGFLASTAFAEPIEFSEVSLLVRARENEGTIVQEVQRRKLVHALTPQQESTLKAQGARDSLIAALRGTALVLPAAEATAFEARREQASRGARASSNAPGGAAGSSGNDDVKVFEVSAGHPVNLSQWGGPDYEFSFRGRTLLDDHGDDGVMVDTTRSFTHTATYLGDGRADDRTTAYSRSNYVSIMDHAFTRGLRIDRRNPVSMKGVPYTLYPVYAAGGVSLYYIGATSDSVKLAVHTASR